MINVNVYHKITKRKLKPVFVNGTWMTPLMIAGYIYQLEASGIKRFDIQNYLGSLMLVAGSNYWRPMSVMQYWAYKELLKESTIK